MSKLSDISQESTDYIAPLLSIHQFSLDGILCGSTLGNPIEDLIEEDGLGSWLE